MGHRCKKETDWIRALPSTYHVKLLEVGQVGKVLEGGEGIAGEVEFSQGLAVVKATGRLEQVVLQVEVSEADKFADGFEVFKLVEAHVEAL